MAERGAGGAAARVRRDGPEERATPGADGPFVGKPARNGPRGQVDGGGGQERAKGAEPVGEASDNTLESQGELAGDARGGGKERD